MKKILFVAIIAALIIGSELLVLDIYNRVDEFSDDQNKPINIVETVDPYHVPFLSL